MDEEYSRNPWLDTIGVVALACAFTSAAPACGWSAPLGLGLGVWLGLVALVCWYGVDGRTESELRNCAIFEEASIDDVQGLDG